MIAEEMPFLFVASGLAAFRSGHFEEGSGWVGIGGSKELMGPFGTRSWLSYKMKTSLRIYVKEKEKKQSKKSFSKLCSVPFMQG